MQENPKKGSKRLKILITTSAIVFVGALTTAIAIDMSVTKNAQRQALIVAAEAITQENAAAELADRQYSIELRAQTASMLSKAQAEEQKARDEAAEEERKKAEATKPVPAKPAVSGIFEAGAYGYTGSDKLSYWKNYNSDTIGYLHIPGTNISHAVVQNTSDVNYYTKRGYDKQASYYGVLWTNPDTNSSGSSSSMSPNTVIYGHNWTNYSSTPRIRSSADIMFGQLTSYHYANMCRSYPYFYYTTSAETMTFKIFATFYTDLSFNYIQTNGDMSYIINEAKARSRNKFDVDVNSSDKIITLSTCTRAYGSTSNQRFVVMGRLLRAGETISPVNVEYNPNHKQPSVWG